VPSSTPTPSAATGHSKGEGQMSPTKSSGPKTGRRPRFTQRLEFRGHTKAVASVKYKPNDVLLASVCKWSSSSLLHFLIFVVCRLASALPS